MKQIIMTLFFSVALLPGLCARCLVVTLSNGQRLAFDLDDRDVVMTTQGNQLVFNGYNIHRERITEFRIFAKAPEGAIAVGIQEVSGERNSVRSEVYDLSGRRITALKPGIYVINNKKIVIR